MTVSADTIMLIAALRTIAKIPPSCAKAWIVRLGDDNRIEVTQDPGVQATATWWISRPILAELLWVRDIAVPLPDALNDPDEAVKIAGYVRDYVPPKLRRTGSQPMRRVPPV